MTEYQKQHLFYQQFNTVIHNHQEWKNTPQGMLEILRDPWKAQPPVVRVDPNIADPDNTQARDILKLLQARHNKAVTVLPPVVVTGGQP